MFSKMNPFLLVALSFLFINCGNVSSPPGTTPILNPIVNSFPSVSDSNGDSSSSSDSKSCSDNITIFPQGSEIEHDVHGFSVCAGSKNNLSTIEVHGDLVGSNSLCAIPSKEDEFGKKSIFYDINRNGRVFFQCSQTAKDVTTFSFPELQSNAGFNALYLIDQSHLMEMLNCLYQGTSCENDYYYGRFRLKGSE